MSFLHIHNIITLQDSESPASLNACWWGFALDPNLQRPKHTTWASWYLKLVSMESSAAGRLGFAYPVLNQICDDFYVCYENGFDHTSSCHFHLSTFRCCEPQMICSKVLKKGEKLQHRIFRHSIVSSDLQFTLYIIFIMDHFIFTYKTTCFVPKQ